MFSEERRELGFAIKIECLSSTQSHEQNHRHQQAHFGGNSGGYMEGIVLGF